MIKSGPRIFGVQVKTKRIGKSGDFVFSALHSKILIGAFYLLVIGIFAVVLNHALHATGNDNLATVDFYANSSQIAGEGNSWTGADRVLGAPEVSDNGAASDFNTDNSAVYSGGTQDLILDNFTTSDFIKNSAPTVVTSTPVILENKNSSTTEENIPAPVVAPTSTAPAIASSTAETSTVGTQDFAFLHASTSSTNNAGEQNIVTPATDNSAAASAQDGQSQSSSDNLPAAVDNSAAPVSTDNNSSTAAPADSSVSSPADSTAPAQGGLDQPAQGGLDQPAQGGTDQTVQNHLPDSAPAQGGQSLPATDSSADAPVSFLQDLKNIAAVGKNQLGETLLGKLALADTQWGSNADDRNILFGPFASAKIKISLAAILQAQAEDNSGASSSAVIDTVGTQNLAFLRSTSSENSQPIVATSTPQNPAGVILQKILDFFAPNNASAQVNNSAAPLTVWYSFSDEGDGNVWRTLGTIDASALSNAGRGGYLSFDAPFLNDWRDLDNLKIKFSGNADNKNFSAYLDSVWVEISYQNGLKKTDAPAKNVDKDKLDVDGREINFTWTDNNSNENLIIKSDQKNYFGLTNAEMYFSVENTGVRDEDVNFQFYFPATSSSVVKINELVPNSPYLTQVPKYEAQIYDCANGWDKRENIYSCYPTGVEHACDEVSPNRRYCRMEGVMTGVEQKIQYADRWQELNLADKSIAPQENFWQKMLGLGPQTKTVPDNFTSKKATADSVSIAPGEVKYFKANINFLANSAGEFYLEAVGDNDGYGLLDPWWNSGWNYRLPITIDNTGNANALTDYQLYLNLNASTSPQFWRHIKSDGSDIRFSNSAQTQELPYWIQSFDRTASSAKIWIKVDSIPAHSSGEVYLYYGNSGAVSASDQFAPFTYSTLQNIFYTASSSPSKTINVVSLIDNNQVQVDGGSVINLNRQQTAIFTGFSSSSVVKAKGPIMAKISGGAGLESAIPISFAGTSFAIPSNRNVGNFNVYAPFAAANVSLYDGLTLKQTHAVSAGSAWTTTQNIATDSIAILASNQPVLFSFANNLPGDSLLGLPAGNRDLYGVKSQYNLIGAAADSSFNILCSNNSSATISSLPAGAIQPNQICSGGAKGTGDAVRLANISGKINAIQQDEGTSSESTMFLPFKEFSSEYMLPTAAAHIAVVCAPESGVVDLSIYDQNNNFVTSGTCAGSGAYPGKAYFGAADATTYLAGSRIVSTNGQPFYAYYKDTTVTGGAETNLFAAVQTRNYSSPNPSFTFGSEEIEGPPTGVINSAAEKSDHSGNVAIAIAVNDLSQDNCRGRVEYVLQSGGHCNFASPLKATLDASSVSASYGLPVIANKNSYQIGTSTGEISTASGTNIVLFNWNSKADLPNAAGTYCLRLTANDYISDQAIPATTTVAIDNSAPTQPGNLILISKTGASATFKFAATSSDDNFKEYRIYYKLYDGTPATIADNFFGSSSDVDLANANLNRATTTTITGLSDGLKYTFNLFAFDIFGNHSSSSANIDVIANDAPTAKFNSAAEKNDGSGRVDVSFTANDANHDNTLRAKIIYQAGAKCDFISSSSATIETDNITATYGTVVANNNQGYQIGTTSNYILTSPGANTINFDWRTNVDLPAANGAYCLRLITNDGTDNQLAPSDIVVVLDNVKPIAAGNLQIASTTETSIQLILPTGHPAQDANEPAANAYKIFYRVGTAGVTPSDSQFTSTVLNAYNFNGSSSVVVSGLSANTHYVFNIFAYDTFGNAASSSEVTARTDADLTNKSLQFINAVGTTSPNIAVADNSSAWDFRGRVSDVDGAAAINDVTLRLADNPDNSAPFNDLQFTWTRSSGAFAETGADVNSAASISPLSTSTCAANSCQIDFKIIFAPTFASSSVIYSGELYSTDASSRSADDVFNNIFQIRHSWIDQEHYRWRNDNGSG